MSGLSPVPAGPPAVLFVHSIHIAVNAGVGQGLVFGTWFIERMTPAHRRHPRTACEPGDVQESLMGTFRAQPELVQCQNPGDIVGRPVWAGSFLPGFHHGVFRRGNRQMIKE